VGRGLPQGQARRVGPGDRPQQAGQFTTAAEARQIAHQGQTPLRVPPPAQAQAVPEADVHGHRLLLSRKPNQRAVPLRSKLEGFQSGDQQIGVAQHRGQGREMGHGGCGLGVEDGVCGKLAGEAPPMPMDAENLSDAGERLQWPLPQPWPSHGGPLRLGVMASGEGSNFEALVAASRNGPLRASVELLVVNQEHCGARARAERLGIACQWLDHRAYPRREDLDGALILAFQAAAVDLVVMAGWMRIVTSRLIEAFPDRLLNIHPSLLPSFPGLDAVGQALAAGVCLTGCTVHLVRPEVDSGPILAQAAVPVKPDDDAATLAARIHHQEHRILPLAVALAARRLQTGGQG